MPKKPLVFWASSKADLTAFPRDAKLVAGHQLNRIQEGLPPDHWKPMKTVGPGVREIIIRAADGAYRVFYIANFGTAVYVLHAFQKKTQQTAQSDIDLAKDRFREVTLHEHQKKIH